MVGKYLYLVGFAGFCGAGLFSDGLWAPIILHRVTLYSLLYDWLQAVALNTRHIAFSAQRRSSLLPPPCMAQKLQLTCILLWFSILFTSPIILSGCWYFRQMVLLKNYLICIFSWNTFIQFSLILFLPLKTTVLEGKDRSDIFLFMIIGSLTAKFLQAKSQICIRELELVVFTDVMQN